jgi:hypothetical protein
MAICPLCENEQASGAICAVCGRALATEPGAARPSPPIEGLEPTRFDAVQAVESVRIEGLEPTALEPLPAFDGGGATAGWIDRTAHEPARADVVERLEVERTYVAADVRVPPDPFAPIVCRYCRGPAAPGDAFCAGCGMKLEIYRPSAPPPQSS